MIPQSIAFLGFSAKLLITTAAVGSLSSDKGGRFMTEQPL